MFEDRLNDYVWRFRMTPEERRMAAEMGRRHYITPTWKDRIMAWLYQNLP